MGYLYLAISKFCAAAKMAAMKNCGDSKDPTTAAVKVNTVRSAIILIVSVIVFAASRSATADGLWIAVLSGASNAINMLSWIVCATAVSLCVVETFVMIGSVVVPLALSPLLYAGETVSVMQWVGAGLIFAAVALFCVGRGAKFSRKGIVWLAVCALSSAGVNISSKLYAVRVGSEYAAFLNLVSFGIVFAFFAVTAAVIVIRNRKKVVSKNEEIAEPSEAETKPREFFRLPAKTYLWIAIAAVGMYATNYFMTLSSALLPSGVLYPLSYGGGFVITALMDTLIFKQKLTPVRASATVLAVIGAVLTAI